MKKAIRYLFVLALLFGLTACGHDKEKPESKSLYAHGMDIVNMLSEMARSDDLLSVYTANTDIKDILMNLGNQEYGTPDAVYAITVPEEALINMAEWNSLQNTSEALKGYLMQRFLASLMSQINAMGGVENLAASSVCTVGKTFVGENADQNVIYLYVYEDAAPVAVTFILGEDHTVSASGTFILYDGFTCGSSEEIRSVFLDIPVEVTEISSEK